MVTAVIVLIALLARAHCFPTLVDMRDFADEDVQSGRGVQDELEVVVEDAEEGEKQANPSAAQTPLNTSAQVATVLMLPTLLNPLLSNIATGITNALSATIMGSQYFMLPLLSSYDY